MRGTLIAAALLSGLIPASGTGQVQDTIPPDQPPPGRAVQDTVGPALPAHAPPRWAISLEAGLLGLDPLQSQPVLAERLDGLGTVLETATLTRSVAGEGGVQAAVSGLLSLGRTWAARLAIGVGRLTLAPRYSGEADLFVQEAARVTGDLDATAWLVSAGAGLRYRIPSSTRPQPYLEVGGAWLRWSLDRSAAFPDLESVGRVSPYATVGAILPLRGSWRAEIRATQRLFRTPVSPTANQLVGPSGSTLRLTSLAPATDAYGTADTARELVSELRLDVGLSLGVGSLPDRPGTAAPPSPPAP